MVLVFHLVITCVRYKPAKLRKNTESKIIQAFPKIVFLHNKKIYAYTVYEIMKLMKRYVINIIIMLKHYMTNINIINIDMIAKFII